jgi:hypothetical protein
MNFKKRIAKWLRITENDIKENDYYYPQKFGESRSVEYQLDGMVKTFCKVTEWSSGEGYDISFITNHNSEDNSPEKSSIELHIDEIQTLLYCLDGLGYFETKP